MINRLRPYKKVLVNSVFVLAVGALLILAYKLIDNAGYVVGNLAAIIGGFLRVVSPIFYAALFAYLLYYPMIFVERQLLKWFKNTKITDGKKVAIRLLSIFTVFATVILLVIMIINYIVPPFVENVKIFINSIPDFEEQISLWVKQITEFLDSINVDYTSNGALMTELRNILLSMGQGVLSSITSFLSHIGTFVVDTVVTVILMFYFLKDKEKLFRAIDKFGTIVCSPRVKKNIKIFIKDLDDIVGKFLIGTIFASFIVAIISTILMLLIRHPFAILIGVAAGITNVIPYVGPIIGAGLAFVLGAFTSLGMGVTGAVLLLLYQQVDGNLIQPKIVGDKVGLAPVWILMAVLIGGSYFGGIGMIVSVPTAALIAVYMDRLYRRVAPKKKMQEMKEIQEMKEMQETEIESE